MGPTKYIRFQEGKQRNGSIKAHEVLGLSNVMRFKILSQIGSWHTKLYKCNLYNSIYHIRQRDKQIDKKVGTLDVMKGLKCVPCPTGFQLHSWIIRRELRRRWRRRQCGGVDGKFAFFPSSSKVAGTRKAGDRDSNRDGWIKKFINQKLSSGLCWVVGAAEKKKSQLP